MSDSRITTGRVVRTDAKVCHVDVAGSVVLGAPRGKLFEDRRDCRNPIAVGDFVRINLASEPASIDEVLPRRNWLGRTASSHDPREQVLVANVDRLFIVASLARPKFSSSRVDRILAAAVWHDIPATLVLNKVDLADMRELDAIVTTYTKAGFDVLPTSATKAFGVEQLRERLSGVVSAFHGGSGVGKSSLLNALQPSLALKIGKISKYWDAGKHTTTHSHLIELAGGGWVIDTPGIRAFHLHAATPADLRGMFPEFARYVGRCRFPDCSHDHEPQCAVFAAVEAGEIAASRFATYVEMLDELRQAPESDGEPEVEDADDA